MSLIEISIKVNVDASAGSLIKYLPDATLDYPFLITYKKIDNTENTVTLTPIADQTIDGDPTKVLSIQYQSFTLYNQDGQWWIG